MRYTKERDPNVLTIPAGEIWVGIVAADVPYIAIAARLHGDDSPVIVTRFGSTEALGMASELVRLAAQIEAPNN